MTAQTQTEEKRVDFRRLYRIINLIEGEIEGFDRAGNPINARGKVLAQRESVRYILQDGAIFDESGKPAERIPPRVKKMVDAMRDEHPFPGVTHAGRVIECPVPGCNYCTTVDSFYREHRRQHRDVTTEQWAALEGGKGQKQTVFTLSDFAEPKYLVDDLTEGAGRARSQESPQGEG